MVPGLTIFFIVLNMLLGIAIPVGLVLFLRRRFSLGLRPVWVGCGTMLLFALVLEQLAHSLVLSSQAGQYIRESFVYTALYGGLMAGLFEECGRYLAMRVLLKKQHGEPRTALLYGAGHGGLETCFLLLVGMTNNLIYALMLNLGQMETLMAPLDAAGRAALQQAIDALIGTTPYLFLLSPLERCLALTAQLALSVPVWFAVVKRKPAYLLGAILAHFVLDAAAVLLAGLQLPALAIEGFILLCAVAIALWARAVWRRETGDTTAEPHSL